MIFYLKGLKQAEGLSDSDREKLSDLVDMWESKLSRNKLRTRYYEGKERLKNLGISIPESLEFVDSVVDWPAKAVDGLQVRSIFDGFTYAGDNIEELESIISENRLPLCYEQATQSELINSCAFATVGRGGVGEPRVVINFHSAEMSSALWDYRKKRIDCGIVVVDIKKRNRTRFYEPVWVNMYTDSEVIEIKKVGEIWRAEHKPHPMGRPLIEVLAFRPSLKHPFGKSRISRAVMSITDNAMRSCLRAELGSEFYTTPQKYLLGADDDDFDKPKWEAYIGNIFVAGKDEDGETPKFGQLPQATMQPHVDYLRSLAAQFSGATSIPISSLGVIHDNPSSAEAIYAAKEDLVIEAQSLNRVNGDALCVIAKMALCISQNKRFDDLTDEEKSIKAHFKNPAMPSLVSQADAMVKIVAAANWISETEVFLEELGFDDATRGRLMSDKKKLQAQALLKNAAQGPTEKQASMYEVQSIIKSYRAGKISLDNAVDLFARIGVGDAEAKALLKDAKDGMTGDE